MALALSLAAVATPTTLLARPRTAVIEGLDLVAAAPGVRIDITVDRPLAWTVGREADGRLRIEVPNARPGYGVVSQLFPGGLVEEIRIVAAGIPSRPLTQIVVTTRGVADHRFDVDGGGFRLELVPTGLEFPNARPAPPIEPAEPPPIPATVAAPIASPPVESSPSGSSRVDPSAAEVPPPSAPLRTPADGIVDVSPAESDIEGSTTIAPPIFETDEFDEPRTVPATPEADPIPADPGIDFPPDESPMPTPMVEPEPVAALEEWDLGLPEALPLPSPTERDQGLELRIEPATEAVVEATPKPGVDGPPDAAGDSAPESAPAPDPADGLESPRVTSPPPLLEKATRLLTISPLAPGVLGIAGDGGFEFTGFRLENPERFVIDLHGIVNHSDLGALEIGEGVLQRVRVSQYRTSPTPITRVIFDLRAPTVPAIESAADGLLVRFAASPALPRLPR